MTWIIIAYLIGSAATVGLLTRLDWVPGTSKRRKIVVTILAVTCWPVLWLMFFFSALNDIGRPTL